MFLFVLSWGGVVFNTIRMWSYLQEHYYEKWVSMSLNHEGFFPTYEAFKYAFNLENDDDQRIINYKNRAFLFIKISGGFFTLLIVTILFVGSQLVHTSQPY
jgi:hypothetical protein